MTKHPAMTHSETRGVKTGKPFKKDVKHNIYLLRGREGGKHWTNCVIVQVCNGEGKGTVSTDREKSVITYKKYIALWLKYITWLGPTGLVAQAPIRSAQLLYPWARLLTPHCTTGHCPLLSLIKFRYIIWYINTASIIILRQSSPFKAMHTQINHSVLLECTASSFLYEKQENNAVRAEQEPRWTQWAGMFLSVN